MKAKKYSLNVEKIEINTLGAGETTGEIRFDCRSDFDVDETLGSVAARITFVNLNNRSGEPIGIRRNVAMAMTDATSGEVIATKSVRVSMNRDEYWCEETAEFPLRFEEINFDHTYKILVRDESSGSVIATKSFHFYNEVANGHPGSWFKATHGYISPNFSERQFLAFNPEMYGYCCVRFNLCSMMKKEPLVMPQLEIRLYRPGCDPEGIMVRSEPLDDEPGSYFAQARFHMDSDVYGICYAEIICLDHVFAGFVFSMSMSAEYGCWTGADLKFMDEYDPNSAFNRYHDGIARLRKEEDGGDSGMDSDEFDRLLDEFIASEKEKTEEPVAEELPLTDTAEPEAPAGSMLEPLDNMVGLASVKQKLESYEHFVRFNKMRADKGMPVISTPLHAMFLGSPGTGKTTVAKLMGRMLANAGILSRGHVVVKERATLMGPNYGNEEANTLKAIEEAQGGILFIDEAYQLYQPNDPRDPGRFVIETLLTALADDSKRDWMLILAGYPDEMLRMFNMNPGFKSRIPQSNVYTFDDFSEPELMEIAENYLACHAYYLSDDARNALHERLNADYQNRDNTFGNARYVMNLIQTDIIPAMAARVVSSADPAAQSLSEIQASDIPAPAKQAAPQRGRIGYCA